MYQFVEVTEPSPSTQPSLQTTYNGINLDDYLSDSSGSFMTLNVTGRNRLRRRINLLNTLGMDGAHEEQKATEDVHEIIVSYKMQDKTNEGFIERFDKLKDLLVQQKKRLEFTDDDKFYYATLYDLETPEENTRDLIGTITFVCSDPYKYGEEKELNFTDDSIIIDNKGTASAKPIIELTAKEKSTFAMVTLGDEQFNIIGQPADVDEVVVDEKTKVLEERGETLNEWTESGTDVDGEVTGQLTTDGTGIVVQSYGSGSRWHGPALLKEIEPIQDFEVEMRLRVKAENPKVTYRIEFYIFDENMDVLGKMAIMDASEGRVQYSSEGRIGPFVGKHVNYLISSENYQRNKNHFHGMLRMRRIGKRFEFYVARIGHTSEEGHIHHDTLTQVFNDINNEYQGRLKYVQIHIGKYGDTPSANLPRINAFEVYERNEVTVDETPYIIYPGDVVTFDHINDDVLLNGELSKDNFFGDFFELKKGQNHLTITPENTFDTVVKYRERYR